MNILLRRPLLVASLVLMVLGACHESRYSGDGKLTDDRFSPSQRFVLALGPIDLTKPATATYRLAGLPKDGFVVGFDVNGPPASKPLYEARPIGAVVRLTLTDEHSRVIIDEVGPMNEWTWSGSPHEQTAFVYRQGVSRDVPMPGGYVTPEPVGVKPDEGFGSGFSPRPEGRYALRVHVLKGDPHAAAYTVRLKSVSGGWE